MWEVGGAGRPANSTLVKRKSSFLLQCFADIIIGKCLTSPIHNEISIHITLSTLCLVCNVQLTEVIIVFPSNKWVALTRAG